MSSVREGRPASASPSESNDRRRWAFPVQLHFIGHASRIRRRIGSMQSRSSPRSSGCWPWPRPPFGLPAVSTGSRPGACRGRLAMSLRSIPRAKTALPDPHFGSENQNQPMSVFTARVGGRRGCGRNAAWRRARSARASWSRRCRARFRRGRFRSTRRRRGRRTIRCGSGARAGSSM